MSEFKKLFRVKRILAMVLALALTVTSVPLTAQAAPGDNPEQAETTVEETSTAEKEADTEETPAAVNEDAGSEDTEALPTDADVEMPEGTESAPVDADVETPEGTESTPVDADVETPEDVENVSADQVQTDTEQEAAEPDASVQGEERAAADGHSFEYYGEKEYVYSKDSNPFSSDGKKLSSSFLGQFELHTSDWNYEVTLDSADEKVDTVTWQWFQGDTALGEPKKLSEEGVIPTDAGSYTLQLTLPAKEGEGGYGAAEETFSFEITKADVTIEVAEPEMVTPGTAVADVPLPEVYGVYELNEYGEQSASFTYVQDDPTTADADESANNEVKLTSVIRDAATGEPAEGKLSADTDYVIAVKVEFAGANAETYAKNHNVKDTYAEQVLTFSDLKETRLSVSLDDTKFTDVNKYKVTKDAVIAADENGRTVHVVELLAGTAVTEVGEPLTKDPKLETPDGVDETTNEQKWKDITVDTDTTLFEGAWYTAADYTAPWTEAGKAFCGLTVGGKLDAAPTTAGAYVYRYSYKGDQKEYAGSFADVLVIMEVPEIIVKPDVPEGTKFYGGQPVNDVLAKIGYTLPYVDGRAGEYPQTENMWGTSYDDSGRTQPYKPAFDLVEITKDGEETIHSGAGNTTAVLEAGNEYYVRFSGSKIVYNGAGSVYSSVGIMAGVDSMDPDSCGFKVKTDADTNKANQLKLDVGGELSIIDVSGIKKDGMGSEKVNGIDMFTKTYDGEKIFLNHTDYKQAKLGSADSNRDFTYYWRKSSLSFEQMTGTHKEGDTEVPNYSKEEIEDSFRGSVSGINLVNAGVYRLEVNYNDPNGETFAEPAYVYFVIKKQTLTFDLSAELKAGLTGYTGNYGNAFIENNKEDLSKTSITVELEGKPSASADWKNSMLSEEADYAYQVRWQLAERVKTTGEDGKEVDETNEDGTLVLSPYYGSLDETADKYVLLAEKVELGITDEDGYFSASSNYENNFSLKLGQLFVPITVKPMGTAVIGFDGITTDGGVILEATKEYDGESIFDLIKDKLSAFNAPITVGEDGKKTGDVTDAELTYTVSYVSSTYGYNEREEYKLLSDKPEDWAWAKNGGTYYIMAAFAGNDKYQPMNETLAEIRVTQRELTLVMPQMEKTYETGVSVAEAIVDAEKAFLDLSNAGLKGEILDADKEYFTKKKLSNGKEEYPIWSDYYDEEYRELPFYVYDKLTKEQMDAYYDGVFRSTGEERYSLIFEINWESSPLCGEMSNNYTIAATDPEAGMPIKVGRGASTVKLDDYYDTKLDITDKVSNGVAPVAKAHEVTVQDAIPYNDNAKPEGNVVRVTIEAPAEYQDADFEWSKVSYQKSIENNAKENLIGSIRTDDNSRTLTFTYNATDKRDLTFSIRWAANYNENFTILFSNAEMLGDLKNAVAPKSLAFNAPLTSMVVGQEQTLDVKITKEQMGDVICLGYGVVEGHSVLHVSEYGKVTALKEGSATVEVYPMHLVDGKKERITTDAKGKPIKAATAKITVKKVSAPKISKVIANDYGVNVQYALPSTSDGYRREIYVMEGKNLNTEAFETEIKAMKNQQWKGHFATQPIFVTPDDEKDSRLWDAKKHTYVNTVSQWIGGLKPDKTEYTVYVRNVSGMRGFEDGCTVELSCAGSVKGFATTTIQASRIVATLQDLDVYSIDEHVYEEEEKPTDEDIRQAGTISYEVPLSEKSVQISLEGLFEDAAGDGEYLSLPLDRDAKNKYTDPKVAYYFSEWIYDGYDAYSGYSRREEYGYTTVSSIGTIANNGKITLKDTGRATVYAVDTISGAESNAVVITVTAEADKMAARKVSMQVGQRVRLSNLVDYKEGNLKLGQNYNNTHARIDVKAAKASLGTNEDFTITDDGYLVANRAATVEFDLKDENIADSVHVKVTAKALDAVKGLKAINVIDNRFDVQFEMNPYAEAYRIKVTDGRGTLIRSIYVENIPFNNNGEVLWDGVDQTEDGWHQVSYSDDDWGDGENWDRWNDWGYDYFVDPDHWHNREHWVKDKCACRADMIKGKMNLTYRIDRLTQSSKYNVEVTTLYKDEQSAKPAKVAATTTRLPAYDYYTNSKIEKNSTRDRWGGRYEWGMPIYTREGYNIVDYSFVSGNTYSLTAESEFMNMGAKYAGTDTLTWSSSNPKVASVQATSGGYSAVLKALKDGETVIEVKSKVLKGVIARYTITVSAVGNAYNSYGENEDLRWEESYNKKGAVTKLTVGVSVVAEIPSEGLPFEVTINEEGRYVLYQIVDGKTVYTRSYDVSPDESFPYKLNGTIGGEEYTDSRLVVKRIRSLKNNTDSFKNRKTIKLGERFNANYGSWYVFTAAEAGFYGIKDGDSYLSSYYFTAYKPNEETAEDGTVNIVGGEEPNTSLPSAMDSLYKLEQNQLVYLYFDNGCSDLKLEKVSFDPLSAGGSITLSGYSQKWYEFTAAEAGEYQFVRSGSGSLEMYDASTNNSITDNYSDFEQSYDPDKGQYVYTYTYTFTAEQKIYIRATSSYGDVFKVEISKKVPEQTQEPAA